MRLSLPAARVPAAVPIFADNVPDEMASPEPTMTPPKTLLVAVGREYGEGAPVICVYWT